MADRGDPTVRIHPGVPSGISTSRPVPTAAAPSTAVLDPPCVLASGGLRLGSASTGQFGEDLFVPVIAPVTPPTPGLGHAFGAGRRIPAGHVPASAAGSGSPVERWWESPAYTELEQAVEAVFATSDEQRQAETAELIRPYIEHLDDASVRAGVGIVPPPTPVAGTRLPTVKDGALGSSGTLPTRRELRERRKAEESARSAARARLVKGGVVAVAMLGAVATQAPQALHERLFGGATTADPAAANLATASVAVDTASLPRDGVEQTLRQQLLKKNQVQQVSEAAQDAGRVLVSVAEAQAASDEAARQAALARATREAQRNPQALARIMVGERGWSAEQFTCLNRLWERESNWSHQATNPRSGAYGIPQALPGSKMAAAGSDWRTNPATQIAWGLDYIADRYGTPCAAWDHSERVNWY